jgi:hypothetical protein
LSRTVVPWIAPAALALLFIIMFFTWVGRYSLNSPEPVVQSGWGTGFGSDFTGLGLLHNLLYLLTLLLAFAVVLVPRLNVKLPPAAERIWPHRSLILGGAVLLLVVLLGIELILGFGLESATARQAAAPTVDAEKTPSTGAPAPSIPADVQVRFARLTLYRTAAPYVAFLLELAALAGVALEVWLERRGDRRPPAVHISW